METNALPQSSVFRQSSNPVLKIFIAILSFMLVFAMGDVLGYWLGVSNNPLIMTEDAVITDTLEMQPTGTEREGWSTYDFKECRTTFSLPPGESRLDGRYWHAPVGAAFPNLLSLVYPFLPDESYDQTAAMFTAEGEASGYIPAAVVVTCADFRDNTKSNNDILRSLAAGIKSYNEATFEKGMGPQTYTMTSSSEQKWGLEVLQIMLNGEEYFTFAHNGKIYEVRAFGAETDPQIVSERTEIYDSLQFTE